MAARTHAFFAFDTPAQPTSKEEKLPATNPADVVETFITHLNEGRIDQGMDLLAEDVFYHNIPMAPMTGRESVRAFAHEFGMGTRFKVDWDTIAIAASGDTVLTERVDAFRAADGGLISIPLMGSFRIRDGLIAEWRDYFDLGDFERQLASLAPQPDTAETPGV